MFQLMTLACFGELPGNPSHPSQGCIVLSNSPHPASLQGIRGRYRPISTFVDSAFRSHISPLAKSIKSLDSLFIINVLFFDRCGLEFDFETFKPRDCASSSISSLDLDTGRAWRTGDYRPSACRGVDFRVFPVSE